MAHWQDFIAHLKEMTGKRLKGRLGGGAGYRIHCRTYDLMAEAGCLHHTSWIIDDQPRYRPAAWLELISRYGRRRSR
jgi:hypothetical protein